MLNFSVSTADATLIAAIVVRAMTVLDKRIPATA
jgi:hypothetical protein